MTLKTSKDVTLYGDRKGDDLNYELNYKLEEGFAHRYSQIGSRYYKYDEAGNITEEREAPFEQIDEGDYYKVEEIEEDVYGVNEAWGYFSDAGPEGSANRYDAKIYHRKFTWDEKNQLIRSTDSTVDVYFVYGEDGKRSHKYTWNTETLYFNNFWSYYKDGTTSFAGGKVSKHIFLGETRLATTINDYAYAVNGDHSTESDHIYYYHSDHLGSAQLVTDYRGDEYERLEYTPYGETWVNVKIQGDNELAPMSFRFSAKELDKETGFYYYGARYLDPKYSRWISADPAMNTGEYFPQAPINDEAKKHNQNLPGMGGVFNHINGNLFAYAANNPIRYLDPDGRDIEVLNNPEKILELINQYSYYKYTVDENGYLIRDGNKINSGIRSKKYSAVIDAAINNHSKTIKINISDFAPMKFQDGTYRSEYNVEEQGGGGCTINVYDSWIVLTITGRNSKSNILMNNFKTHKYTPEEILMHELVGHAIPMLLNVTGGSAIFNENTIRKELGLDERKEMFNDPIIYTYMQNGKFLFMPNK